MDEHTDVPPPSTRSSPASGSTRAEDGIRIATIIGWFIALGAVVAGIARIANRRQIPCPDGTMFSNDEKDFTCYVHPHAFEGGMVIAVAVMLGILIGMVGFLALTTLADRRTS